MQLIAFPRAEKLKKYIKDVFATEETKYKEQIELSKKLAGDFKPESADNAKSSKQMTPEEYEDMKKKYNTENEKELRLLQEKELELLADKNKQTPSHGIGGAIQPPLVNRKLKPKSSNDINNYNLRTVYVPRDLNEKFLEAVQDNTRNNVETCGFLTGKLVLRKLRWVVWENPPVTSYKGTIGMKILFF